MSVAFQASAQDSGQLADSWYLSQARGGVGIDLQGANKLLDSYAASLHYQPVVVAVIDGGFDFTHPQLAPRAWSTGADSIHGWNFLGNAAGENIIQAGSAPWREYKRLRPQFREIDTLRHLSRRKQAEFRRYKQLEQQAEADLLLLYKEYASELCDAYHLCDSLLSLRSNGNPVAKADLQTLHPGDTTELHRSLAFVRATPEFQNPALSWSEAVARNDSSYAAVCTRIAALDRDDDPHRALGNAPSNFRSFRYGNRHIEITPYHGTMVAGVVAACTAAPGVRNAVKIMGIRAIPNGDEYDRDVAAAIRYATDNGAKIINMSFVKELSDNPRKVHQAIRYASRKDVLLVMAAGNTHQNIDSIPVYPLCATRSGKRNAAPLVVGATDTLGRVCSFSCYGSRNVDLFAPGIEILSTAPDGAYRTGSGTSIAAPMVAGVAALIRSVCPDLKAPEVRRILLASVRDLSQTETSIPGRPSQHLHTGDLCASHGLLNAATALHQALQSSKIGQP